MVCGVIWRRSICLGESWGISSQHGNGLLKDGSLSLCPDVAVECKAFGKGEECPEDDATVFFFKGDGLGHFDVCLQRKTPARFLLTAP